jgi:hypothetical protein
MLVVGHIAVGTRLALAGGVLAEVVENLGDGEWLRVRLLAVPPGQGETGAIELCHATDVEQEV